MLDIRARASPTAGLSSFCSFRLSSPRRFMFGAQRMGNEEEHPGLREASRPRRSRASANDRAGASTRFRPSGHAPAERDWVGRPNALWTSSLAAQLLHDATIPPIASGSKTIVEVISPASREDVGAGALTSSSSKTRDARMGAETAGNGRRSR